MIGVLTPLCNNAQSMPWFCVFFFFLYVDYNVGGPDGMDLQGLDDAMLDASTALTHAALSVRDAKRMLSYLVAKFSWEKGYIHESSYVEIIAGWHEAADGRGLTKLQ